MLSFGGPISTLSLFMIKKALYFITGSSGAGKTTLLKGVIESAIPDLAAYHFDDFGLPSLEEMNAKFGGPSEWQAYTTRRWIETIAQRDDIGLAVIDSQARPSAIVDAAKEAGFLALHITLIDCSHAERRRRLVEVRAQPELDNLDMYAWAAYLRGQADALKLEVIDTTPRSIGESVQELAHSIGRFASETGTNGEHPHGAKAVSKA